MKNSLLLSVLGCFSLVSAQARPVYAQAPASAGKAVLVTGASSGIGLAITERLAGKGYFVYAGARSADDIKALDAIPNVKGLRLDVTRQAEIDAAAATVRKDGRSLVGVVNNAGVAIFAPMIEADEGDLQFQFDVNVYGPIRINKAFAPMIIESKGRMVTIGSINGIVAGAFSGPYAMSKHAMEGYTDALAAEMGPLGVGVSIVEPGRYRSSMSANVTQRWREQNKTTAGSRFEAQYQRMVQGFDPAGESRYPEPTEVAEAVEHALADPAPKLRYLVAPTAAQTHRAVRRALERAVEMNQGQRHTMDRAALVALLDSVLARAK
ncbi:MAG: SDR family NAD(P)-dependent oxidoreductase [Gemmatimonadales bacterium]